MPTVRQTSDPPAGEASAAEWRWVALVSLAVIVATCIPYLFGWFITPPGSQYMGLLANPDEHNVYLGWMRQAERGRLLFLDPFTTEPQQAGFFHGFFLTLGIAARLTHVPLIGVYHIARVICGMLLLIGIYALAVQILDGLLARRLAWGLAALSSGFGWLYAAIRPGAAVHPVDFGPGLVMPEAITFLSLLLNPLFCFSVFLMVVLWTAYLAAVRANSWKLAALAGAAGFLLGNVHTYNVITVWLTLVLYIAGLAIIGRRLPAREALFAGLVAVMSAPFVIYQYSLFQANAVFREKALTLTLTPPAAFFIAGYGLVFLLAIPGAIVALGRRDKPQVLLVAWAAATLLLVFFAPVSFQRKMAEGLHVPLCLLAALFVGGWLAAKLRHRMAATLAVALVILGMPSNALFVARGFHDLTTNNAAYVHVLMPPLYLRSDTVEAMRWLRDHATMDEAVLCAPLAGSYVPGAAGTTVFIGHWAETLHYPDKLGDVLWFFSGRPQPGERREFMESNGLRYVLYTPDEAALGPFNPGASPDFDLVLARPQAQLFRLAPAD
ncbi:MAG: hypothetical protein JSV65_03960 [Armatimonadota bacterium]|nr:MAG: hypothetical protein JSV65_03960 [Armatimonadota bacterium]